ncbi:MAG: agmatine deiminase family protein [Acidobacteriota bacterium]|nr:MAG: agmatine deiminase family protein [Acidobacteriota bacterium]
MKKDSPLTHHGSGFDTLLRLRVTRRRFLAGAGVGAAGLLLPGCARKPTQAEQAGRASAQAAVRAPAEWEPHERCLMSWPHRKDMWEDMLEVVQQEYAAVAKAVTQFEPVLMIANSGSGAEAQRQCGENVEVVEFPIDDAWMRDNGPIFVVEEERLVGLDFRFNAWGKKFPPWDKDDALPEPLCEYLEVERRPVDMVLEGGAITMDGQGTLITTEQCLLNPNRNPDMSRSEIEAVLRESLGVKKIIWLPGIVEDDLTDGHVDGMAAFLAPAKIMVETALPSDKGSSWYAAVSENRVVLEAATDAQGRKFEIVDAPPAPALNVAGDEIYLGYINFYQANQGGVVVPLGGVSEDDEALTHLRKVLPDRQVVGVPTPTVGWGGGGVHCITQQMPALPS